MRAFVAIALVLAACGPSAAVKKAQTLIDRGDYAGAEAVAATELDKNPKDGDLWRIRMRAALGQNDAKAAVGYYAAWRGVHGADDPAAMRMMAMTTLWQALESPSADAQVAAIRVVERLEIEQLADAVATEMQDDDDPVAAAAAIAILKSYPQAPQLATDMLGSDDAEARAIAVDGIGRKIGKRAADDLRPLAKDGDPAVRRAVARYLGTIEDPADTELLTQLAGDADGQVREAAVAALARGKRGDLSKLAMKLIQNDQAMGVRLSALGLLFASDDLGDLTNLLSCQDPVMAIGAARLMTKHKPVEARAAIDCAADAQDWIVRAAALNASQAVMSRKSWTELATSKLDDAELGVRLAAARLLGDDPKAVDVFVAALGDADAKLGAAIDLTRLGDDRGLAALGELIGADDAGVRRAAADGYASAHHLDGGIVPALADEDPIVRVTAAGAILTLTK